MRWLTCTHCSLLKAHHTDQESCHCLLHLASSVLEETMPRWNMMFVPGFGFFPSTEIRIYSKKIFSLTIKGFSHLPHNLLLLPGWIVNSFLGQQNLRSRTKQQGLSPEPHCQYVETVSQYVERNRCSCDLNQLRIDPWCWSEFANTKCWQCIYFSPSLLWQKCTHGTCGQNVHRIDVN